jgi:hypothetical protein
MYLITDLKSNETYGIKVCFVWNPQFDYPIEVYQKSDRYEVEEVSDE